RRPSRTAPGSPRPAAPARPVAANPPRHKNAIANSDSQPKAPVQTGPVTTGVEPSTCDADGDGVIDPGAPSSCGAGTGTVSTGVEQGSVAPLPYSATAPRKHRAAPRSSTAKKRVKRR